MPLDLASLESVGSFAKRYASSSDRLDMLVNNAGVMAIPERQTTKDGFEMQFGTNHLGEQQSKRKQFVQIVGDSKPRALYPALFYSSAPCGSFGFLHVVHFFG